MTQLEEMFEYSDGCIYWKQSRGKAKAGKRAGCLHTKDGYRYVQYNKKLYSEHRIIWELLNGEIPEGLCIDHINRDRSDNRIENLRLVTISENGFNRGAKGYHWNSSEKKWKAAIRLNGVTTHLGYFSSEDDARQAYLKAKNEQHALTIKEVI